MHDRLLKFVLALSATSLVLATSERALMASPPLPNEVNNNGGGGSNDDKPTVSTGVDDGVVVIGIDTPGNTGGPRSAPPTYVPTCTWTPLQGSGIPNGDSPLPGGGEQAIDSEGRLGWTVRCPNQPIQVRWTTPTVDPISLIQPASDRARARLPIPVPLQSPAPDIGSYVNLGLWMSIQDPGTTTARATAGSAWAEATGSYAGLSIDPGDGTDTFDCEGFGVAYPEGSNNADEGPCGHTYLQTTPDDAPHIITYTITYDITWRTSDGRSGRIGTFDRQLAFPYDINEIQTVGTHN